MTNVGHWRQISLAMWSIVPFISLSPHRTNTEIDAHCLSHRHSSLARTPRSSMTHQISISQRHLRHLFTATSSEFRNDVKLRNKNDGATFRRSVYFDKISECFSMERQTGRQTVGTAIHIVRFAFVNECGRALNSNLQRTLFRTDIHKQRLLLLLLLLLLGQKKRRML